MNESDLASIVGALTLAALSFYLITPFFTAIGTIPRGPSVPGLRNWGNWCFCNSVLQSVSSLQLFREFLQTNAACAQPSENLECNAVGGVAQSGLLQAMKSMSRLLSTEGPRKTLSSLPLVKALEHVQKTRISRSQQDAQEFLHLLLESMASELNCLSADVSIQQMCFEVSKQGKPYKRLPFEGALLTASTCTVCKHELKSHRVPFLELTLLPAQARNSTVEQCLEALFEQEIIADYNCTRCQIEQLRAKQQDTTIYEAQLAKFPDADLPEHVPKTHVRLARQTAIVLNPDILIIHINRSLFDAHATRNNVSITYPRDLLLGPDQYALRSLITHRGSHDRGHYISIRKKNKGWYMISDEAVRRVTIEDALSMKASVFLLFYEKKHVRKAPRVAEMDGIADEKEEFDNIEAKVHVLFSPHWSLQVGIPEFRSFMIRIVSHPPFVGVTESRSSDIKFEVIVTSDTDLDQFELQLWSQFDTQWSHDVFSPVALDFPLEQALEHLRSFTLDWQAKQNVTEFTLRYKFRPEEDWQWVSRASEDGTILVFKKRKHISPSLEDIFENGSRSIAQQAIKSDIAGLTLFTITHPAPLISPDLSRTELGFPRNIVQYLALERIMAFWMGPTQGRETIDLSERDAVMLAFQRTDGNHVVLVPISGLKNDCQTFIKSTKEGSVELLTKNDGIESAEGKVIVGFGTNLQELLTAVFGEIRSLFQSEFPTPRDISFADDRAAAKWYEEWTDGLYYCTWNAMYTDVTEDKILDTVQQLHDKGVYVTGIIIDDGWQDIDDDRRWKAFEPPIYRFPHGLKHTVTEVKRRFPYIKHVGVWHALLGYWNGVSPDSWLSKRYRVQGVPIGRGSEPYQLIAGEDAERLYDDFYRYLDSQGISVVKTDAQASADEISQAAPEDRRTIWRSYANAFKKASTKWFQRRVIYCMSHVPNIFQYALLQNDGPPACMRNSDDFFPDIKSSHSWHIFCNNINNLYTSQLHILPDWDMFQTHHEYSELHAVGRALSGGPIYITDSVGQTNTSIVDKMTSLSPKDSHTTVLRFDRPSLPRYPYTGYRETRSTKITNSNKGVNVFALGVFNTTTQNDLTELIRTFDFSDDMPDGAYAVLDTKSRTAVATERYGGCFAISLNPNECRIFVASPLRTAQSRSQVFQVTTFGLVDKYAGAAAVTSTRLNDKGRTSFEIKLKYLGVLGIYISNPEVNKIDNLLITLDEILVPKEAVKHRDTLLFIDTREAWELLKFSRRECYTDELSVKVYF